MISRYRSDGISGIGYSSGKAISSIRAAIRSGRIHYSRMVVSEGSRLDKIAHEQYGDGRLWWIIAAASNIGWWLQVTPGTVITIPTDLTQIEDLV